MIFEAYLYFLFLDGIGCYRQVAGTDRIEFMNQIQYGLNRITETIGSVILTCFLIDGTCFKDPGVGFFGDANGWITFSVLEQNIVMRLVLLNEVVL